MHRDTLMTQFIHHYITAVIQCLVGGSFMSHEQNDPFLKGRRQSHADDRLFTQALATSSYSRIWFEQ